MNSKNHLLLAVFCISLGILVKFGFQKFILCLLSLAVGYLVARFAYLTNFTFFDSSIKKKAKNPQQQLYSSQELKHLKSIKKSSASNLIKSSSSSSSISSLPTSKTASPASSSNSKSVELTFEFHFRRTYPWHSVYLPRNVDKSFEDLLSPIIQEYVLSWYSKISKDDGLILETKSLFRHILANLIIRAKHIDLNYLLTYKLNTILYNHITDFVGYLKTNNPEFLSHKEGLKDLTSKQRLEKQFDVFKSIVQSNNDQFNHFALSSRRNEIAYLRKLCNQVLPFLLPDSIIKCRAAYELVQEIAVSNLLLPMLDVVSRPQSINKLLTNMFSDGESVILRNNKNRRNGDEPVQLLKHWSQMNGCIFKSIQTPSFNELIENNENLCIFINYLNTFNSLSILQFYLMIKDILKTYNESSSDESESTNSPNVGSQIEELKVWCKNNQKSLDAIMIDHSTSYFAKLEKIISSDSIDHDVTKKLLQKTHSELHNLIKETYYSSFIKSDFIFRQFYGLQRLNSSPMAKSPIVPRKKTDSQPASVTDTSQKENHTDDSFSLSNNDLEIDDLDFKSTTENPDQANKIDIGENDDDEDDNELAEIEVENLSTGSAKLNSEVRLDLINEINDEFLDDDTLLMGTRSLTAPQQISLDDEDENLLDPVGLDGGDDEGDGDDDDSSLNLSNLRVAIDGVDEVSEAGSRTGYVFVIQVWNLDPKLLGKPGNGETPNWFVKRKYDEFYVLDNRLRQFHGGDLMTTGVKNQLAMAQLPAKPRAILSFSNKENNLEYLESVQNDFERYLQSLLSNPILSKSKLINSFLDPGRIEFNSSLLNNITNIGKMVKGVPYKLRFERGQSLDSFLAFLFKTIRQPKPKSSQTCVNYEDITDKTLNQSEFSNPEKSKTIVKKSIPSNDENEIEYLVSPFESLIFLICHIYKLPRFLCLLVFSLRRFVQKLFDRATYWYISRKVNQLTTPEAIEQFIILLTETVFDKEPPSNHDYYQSAHDTINNFFAQNKLYALARKIILDEKLKSAIGNGTRLFLEPFQYPILNKHLIYKILDALLVEIFPELDDLNSKSAL